MFENRPAVMKEYSFREDFSSENDFDNFRGAMSIEKAGVDYCNLILDIRFKDNIGGQVVMYSFTDPELEDLDCNPKLSAKLCKLSDLAYQLSAIHESGGEIFQIGDKEYKVSKVERRDKGEEISITDILK